MVKSINDIGHVMGKRTIAEFAESESVLGVLRESAMRLVNDHVLGCFRHRPCALLAKKIPGSLHSS